MRFFSALVLAAFAVTAQASNIHTLSSAISAVEKGNTSTTLLIYKVKDQRTELRSQDVQPFFSKSEFATTPLFRKIYRMSNNERNVLAMSTQKDISEFSRYFVRNYPEGLSKEKAIEELSNIYRDGNVEFAYFETRAVDAIQLSRMHVVPMQAAPTPADAALGDYEAQQFYLNAAPEGVDARFIWNKAGGTGKGIRLMDVETGWKVDHFEFGPVFYDNGKNAFTDHGTAVWGEIGARKDGLGTTGIAHEVEWGIAANGFKGFGDYPTTIAAVIEDAALQLVAGDVMVIEQHAPLVDDYGPIEYFEPVFKALQLATSKGIHCVAAAGNGYSNLDDAKYNGAFDLSKRDSGCILVGAADSPKSARARQRSDFSDYGSRVDAFGYGEDVVSSGYGDLFTGTQSGKLAIYTNSFSGTSSATTIVAGSVVAMLGAAKAAGKVITPAEMRAALRATGSPQEGDVSQRIGNLPNLAQLYAHFFPAPAGN